MDNTEALVFFKNMSEKMADNDKCVKLACNTDCTDIDAKFIMNYADKNTEMLDIGTGTGLIVNKMYNNVKSIVCLEPFKEFTDHLVKSSNIQIVNENIFDFKTNKIFDLITIFGSMHYFNEAEAKKIYLIVKKILKLGGKLIVKNQFGVKEDITVSGYSEEQKTDYFAQYRYILNEIKLLENIGFKNIETFDIYPPEANRWDNTHFYAIVATK